MGRPVTLVFLVDALGWEIVDRFQFASSILARRAPLDTVLGYSAAAIPSLLSGTVPSEHGSWAMFRAARPGGAFGGLRGIPPLPHAAEWRARRWARRWLDRRAGVRAYYDLYEIPLHLLHRFDLGQKGNPFRPGGLSRATVFDWMEERSLPYRLWSYDTPEEENLAAAERALVAGPGVLFVYTAELDALMHRVGIFDEAVAARLRRYERFLGSMQAAARSADVDLTIILLSDHGMTDVTTTVDPWGALSASGLRLGRDYLAFFDSTMARFWGGGRALEVAAGAFASAGATLTADELRALGCYFEDGAYGDTVMLANPGVLIVPSFMGARAIAAMHGYHPSDRFSRGCFLTTVESAPVPGSILGFKRFFESVQLGATG